jgi:hypothetical protein
MSKKVLGYRSLDCVFNLLKIENRTARMKTTVLSCHRGQINTGVEKMNKI